MRDNPNSEETLSGSGAPPQDSRDNFLSRTIQKVAMLTLIAHYPPLHSGLHGRSTEPQPIGGEHSLLSMPSIESV